MRLVHVCSLSPPLVLLCVWSGTNSCSNSSIRKISSDSQGQQLAHPEKDRLKRKICASVSEVQLEEAKLSTKVTKLVCSGEDRYWRGSCPLDFCTVTETPTGAVHRVLVCCQVLFPLVMAIRHLPNLCPIGASGSLEVSSLLFPLHLHVCSWSFRRTHKWWWAKCANGIRTSVYTFVGE
jgi:hypothetical protein